MPRMGANNAKKQMCSIFAEEASAAHAQDPASRGDGNSTSLCKIQGVVTRTKDETVNGPRGPIPKKRIDIIVTGIIANGAQDIIRTGVEGENYDASRPARSTRPSRRGRAASPSSRARRARAHRVAHAAGPQALDLLVGLLQGGQGGSRPA